MQAVFALQDDPFGLNRTNPETQATIAIQVSPGEEYISLRIQIPGAYTGASDAEPIPPAGAPVTALGITPPSPRIAAYPIKASLARAIGSALMGAASETKK